MTSESPWLTVAEAIEYLTHGARTPGGYRKFSQRFIRSEVAHGRLQAVRVGGRGQLYFTREWLDEYFQRLKTPLGVAPVRRVLR